MHCTDCKKLGAYFKFDCLLNLSLPVNCVIFIQATLYGGYVGTVISQHMSGNEN